VVRNSNSDEISLLTHDDETSASAITQSRSAFCSYARPLVKIKNCC